VSVPQTIALADVAPGMEVGEATFGPLERADIVRYAGASGDFNPIHVDEGYARASGAPTVFAMGMLPAGQLAHALSDWFGGPQRLRRFKVRFTARVWPGDEIVCRGRVVSVADGLVEVALQALRRGPGPAGLDVPEQERALLAEAVVELPE
jgi:acyl dehydratase